MNLYQKLMVLLFPVLVSSALFADETIYPHDSFESEKGYRAMVEEEFPKLELGFYHWNGDFLIGALEDFDRDRILLLLSGNLDGAGKILRNGKELALSLGKPYEVKVAGAMATHKGTIDHPESASDQRIGYRVDLEATDTLSISIKKAWPLKGVFHATYDPDAKWKTSFQWNQAEEKRKTPADAYEVSRKSLVKRVTQVLKKQKQCVIRFEDGFDISASNFSEEGDDVAMIRFVISDKILVEEAEFRKEMLPAQVVKHLELFDSAANVVGVRVQAVIEVNSETDDQVFRSTLKAMAKQGLRRVEFLQRKVGEDKKEELE